ncbi:MAG: pseudouridine synthase [Dokdonella sp.]
MAAHSGSTAAPRHGLARALSKLGVCSRTQATAWIREGRVALKGHIERDPEAPAVVGVDQIDVDGVAVGLAAPVYVMLNKPRGIVTTASDEQGRATVYDLLRDARLPWISPVGRLDRASEGLLLLSNNTQWASGITEPRAAIDKRYHVQIDRLPDVELLNGLVRGVSDRGELLSAKSVVELRRGQRNAWLEIVLDEGRNRQIRRLLAAFDINVLRLVRIAIGGLQLGDLPRGQWRHLQDDEVAALWVDEVRFS